MAREARIAQEVRNTEHVSIEHDGQRCIGDRKTYRAAQIGRVAVGRRQETSGAMFGEHREGSSVVGEVPNTEAIVGHQRVQPRREVVEESPRLNLSFKRPRDGRETDE